MRIRLDQKAKERSSFLIEASFYDADGAAVTPTSAVWTLSDVHGAVINGRLRVPFSPLGQTVRVVLSGADLALQDDNDSGKRLLTIEAVYSSTIGSDLPLNEEALFEIQPLAVA